MRLFLSICCLMIPAPGLGAAEPLLKAAFAEVDVSPAIDKFRFVYLAGFGHNRIAKSLHDPIMARSVVLSDGRRKIAFVSVDVVGLFLPFVESIRQELTGFDYVLVSSTHNHDGPDTMGLWGPSVFQSGLDEAYMRELRGKIVASVRGAEAQMQPARVRIAHSNIPHLQHDNRLPVVKHDELGVLEFRSPDDDKRIGILINWHCHPETMGSRNLEISADFVGSTVAGLKKAHSCPVAYFSGTVGGLMTSLNVPIRNERGESLKDGTFEKTEGYGRAIADEATSALKTAEAISMVPFTIRTRRLLLPVDNPIYRAAWQLNVLKRPTFVWNGDPQEKQPKAALDSKAPLAILSEVGYLKLGDLEIAAIPGEIYPELVLGRIQDPVDPGADFPDAPKETSIHEASHAKHRLLFGLANDEVGYIIPKRQWDEKAPYCYGLKKPQYGEINSLGPDTAPILMKGYSGLASEK